MRAKVEATVVGVRIVDDYYAVDVAPVSDLGAVFTVPLGGVEPKDHPRIGDKVTVCVLSEGLR